VEKIAIYEMDYFNSLQIDTLEDLYLCEYVLKRKLQGMEGSKNEV